jgi:DNA-binding NtrC family response regulator
VRELQNVVERSVIVCETDEFTVDESWLSLAAAGDRRVLASTLASHERAMIADALQASGGRVYGPADAAARLGWRARRSNRRSGGSGSTRPASAPDAQRRDRLLREGVVACARR